MSAPAVRPKNPQFASGPCAKRPGWSLDALAGAHLMAVPTALMKPFRFIAEQVVRARAWENQMYVAYVNHDGREGELEYVGRSSITTAFRCTT